MWEGGVCIYGTLGIFNNFAKNMSFSSLYLDFHNHRLISFNLNKYWRQIWGKVSLWSRSGRRRQLKSLPSTHFSFIKKYKKKCFDSYHDIFLGMCKPVQCLSLIFSYVILCIPKQWFTWGSQKFTKDSTSVILSLSVFSTYFGHQYEFNAWVCECMQLIESWEVSCWSPVLHQG